MIVIMVHDSSMSAERSAVAGFRVQLGIDTSVGVRDAHRSWALTESGPWGAMGTGQVRSDQRGQPRW